MANTHARNRASKSIPLLLGLLILQVLAIKMQQHEEFVVASKSFTNLGWLLLLLSLIYCLAEHLFLRNTSLKVHWIGWLVVGLLSFSCGAILYSAGAPGLPTVSRTKAMKFDSYVPGRKGIQNIYCRDENGHLGRFELSGLMRIPIGRLPSAGGNIAFQFGGPGEELLGVIVEGKQIHSVLDTASRGVQTYKETCWILMIGGACLGIWSVLRGCGIKEIERSLKSGADDQ